MTKLKTKLGYYTIMEMDMKTGESKFKRFEKITLDDKLGDFIWYNKWWLRTSYILMFLTIILSPFIFLFYLSILEFGIIRNSRTVCF